MASVKPLTAWVWTEPDAWNVLIPPEAGEPELRTHEGYEWLYVLSAQCA
jgi:hypothetical protein